MTITIFAPEGMGEVQPGTDLAELICDAVAADPSGPLMSGDIVVVTSKIISKAESRNRPAAEREEAIAAESVGTVARRGATRIVRTRHGLTLAAAGVDNSNVAPDTVLLLPVDPDASAARLRRAILLCSGRRVGVVISDTAGRPWRMGQTDQAIGASGVVVVEDYAGRYDRYGNELQVTAVAVADELASAADLAKTKLAHRPVAVIRGLSQHVTVDPDAAGGAGAAGAAGGADAADAADAAGGAGANPAETGAAALVREASRDMFRYGSREAVVAAVLAATGQSERYEDAVAMSSGRALVDFVLAGSRRTAGETELLRDILEAAWPG